MQPADKEWGCFDILLHFIKEAGYYHVFVFVICLSPIVILQYITWKSVLFVSPRLKDFFSNKDG